MVCASYHIHGQVIDGAWNWYSLEPATTLQSNDLFLDLTFSPFWLSGWFDSAEPVFCPDTISTAHDSMGSRLCPYEQHQCNCIQYIQYIYNIHTYTHAYTCTVFGSGDACLAWCVRMGAVFKLLELCLITLPTTRTYAADGIILLLLFLRMSCIKSYKNRMRT